MTRRVIRFILEVEAVADPEDIKEELLAVIRPDGNTMPVIDVVTRDAVRAAVVALIPGQSPHEEETMTMDQMLEGLGSGFRKEQ